MKKYLFAALPLLLSIIAFAGLLSDKPRKQEISKVSNLVTPKIQVAILLDVSNSMDGLIEQAKAQLWNMASVMGRARCGNDITPNLEIALYEYGRPGNDAKLGFVKQISAFTTDLDELSKSLFNLKTDGGDEYCGQVMYTSLTQLKWDTSATNYKVIFIAGNEDFLQGNVPFTRACAEAKKKGVIVNTIFCGDRLEGIREHWRLGGECGNGSYTNINKDAALEDIPTPYDTILFSLNEQLNQTYIGYGVAGVESHDKQQVVDKMNYNMNKSAAAKRVAVKGKKELYKNSQWDLVDAEESDPAILDKLEMKTLPDSLQKKTRTELKQIVHKKNEERTQVQQKINAASTKRDAYISEQKRRSTGTTTATLESEIEKIIHKQAKQFNIRIL